MIKKSLKVMGVSILTALLAISLTACERGNGSGKSSGEKSKTNSGNVAGRGPATEWEVLTSEAMELYSSGDYTQGVKVAKQALQVAQKDYGPDHPNVALSLSNLAEFYEAQKEYSEAEPLYKSSLQILEKTYDQDNPFLVPTLLNMASLYKDTGRENEARQMIERANNIQAKQ